MKRDRLPVIVLVVALAALGATAAWAAVAASGSKTSNNYYGSMMGSGGMMGNGGTMMRFSSAGAHPVGGLADAKQLGQRFADRLGLKAGEVLQFQRNYYVKLLDKQGHGATEVLVDPQSGAVTLEYGPAMMWNTRYGMHGRSATQMMGRYGAGMMKTGGMMQGGGAMGGGMMERGMMGGSSAGRAAGPRASADAAKRIAQRWLRTNRPGLTTAEPEAFPGYYTLEVQRQGKIEGMLSVNARTGAVIYHWWHGAFVRELA